MPEALSDADRQALEQKIQSAVVKRDFAAAAELQSRLDGNNEAETVELDVDVNACEPAEVDGIVMYGAVRSAPPPPSQRRKRKVGSVLDAGSDSTGTKKGKKKATGVTPEHTNALVALVGVQKGSEHSDTMAAVLDKFRGLSANLRELFDNCMLAWPGNMTDAATFIADAMHIGEQIAKEIVPMEMPQARMQLKLDAKTAYLQHSEVNAYAF